MLIPRTPEAKARREREQAAKAQAPLGIRPPDSPPSWQPAQYRAEPEKDATR